MKSNRGQILPLAMVMMLVLSFLWIMLINIGQLISARVQMQIAADTAVQSACAIRARALNSIGLLNSWLGIPVLGIGWPQLAWWPVPPHALGPNVLTQKGSDIKEAIKVLKKFADSGYEEGKVTHTMLVGLLQGLTSLLGLSYDIHPPAQPNFAKRQKEFIQLVTQIQENYVKSYGGMVAYRGARDVARQQGADDIYVPPRSFSLGLVRNHGPMWFWSTLHIWYIKWPLPPVPSVPSVDNIVDDPDTKRWYEQGPNFYKKSMRLYAFRRPESSRNGDFPLGKGLFSITMPYLYTVAAARVYNTDGPMFPTASEASGDFGGVAAFTAYKNADSVWKTQLVPVGASMTIRWGRRGQSLIELVMMLPILIGFWVAMIWFARIFIVKLELMNAARHGVFWLAYNHSSMSPAKERQAVQLECHDFLIRQDPLLASGTLAITVVAGDRWKPLGPRSVTDFMQLMNMITGLERILKDAVGLIRFKPASVSISFTMQTPPLLQAIPGFPTTITLGGYSVCYR